MLLIVFLGEYLRRVRTKAFVLTTLLAPLAIVALAAGAGAIMYFSVESESARERRIAVLDEDGRILPKLRERSTETYRLTVAEGPVEAAKQTVLRGTVDGLLVLPRGMADAGGPTEVALYVKDKQSLTAEQALRSFVFRVVRDVRLAQFDLPAQALATLNERLSFASVALTAEGGEEQGSAAVPVFVGVAMATIMLMVMWIYGALVMQATMEEKSSRMAEILVSSVRPFQLLMGKILAIGGMAATQLAAWAAMLLVVAAMAMQALPADDLVELGLAAAEAAEGGGTPPLPSIRFDVLGVILLMLPLGYLINGSFFGALGAMYETPQEAQPAVVVGMAPMFLAVIMVQTVALAPNGFLIVFGSLFPFTAPVLMPTRMLITDVSVWQVLASIVLCIATTLGMVWLAGRVFRGSLLIYGKKLSLRDIRSILVAD